MKSSEDDYTLQMATLQTTQAVFGKGFGVAAHPDDDIILDEKQAPNSKPSRYQRPLIVSNVLKRSYDNGPGGGELTKDAEIHAAPQEEPISQPIRRVRFA
jgi:hypothetical protein